MPVGISVPYGEVIKGSSAVGALITLPKLFVYSVDALPVRRVTKSATSLVINTLPARGDIKYSLLIVSGRGSSSKDNSGARGVCLLFEDADKIYTSSATPTIYYYTPGFRTIDVRSVFGTVSKSSSDR